MHLQLNFDGDFAVITLDRPDVLNALNFALLDALDRALNEVASSRARALIVVGAGPKSFCAGADVAELKEASAQTGTAPTSKGQATISRLASLPMPSIAAVHGFALGGGFELALACTFRVATPTARFGLPEIKLGLLPGYGGTQRLARLVGESRALDLILSGRNLNAEEALQWGVVNLLQEGDPLELGKQFAQRLAPYGLLASRAARAVVRRGLELSLQEGLDLENLSIGEVMRSADAQEGMSAFLEKRPAKFQDR